MSRIALAIAASILALQVAAAPAPANRAVHHAQIPLGFGADGLEATASSISIGLSSSLQVRGPWDGRLLLLVSKNPNIEPRFDIGLQRKSAATGEIVYADTQQVFGVDVNAWDGRDFVLGKDDSVFGFPLRNIRDIPANGTYFIQGFLNVYKTYHRSDGHTVKLHPDGGEGQHMFISPGNLYSGVYKITMSQGIVVNGSSRIEITETIPRIPETFKETEYLRRVKIRSKLLSKFWGTDIFLSAMVLLPQGFWDPEHAKARYPLIVYQGHFTKDWQAPNSFRPTPRSSTCVGYQCLDEEYSHHFYNNWTAVREESGSPYVGARAISITLQHANFYYDDSYSVNSENIGPYGDAIETELIPEVERLYRGIGEGWARVLHGGSTGGWESVAVLVHYPDNYAGAWASCPDPLDFRAYVNVDIYSEPNAYRLESSWRSTPRGEERDRHGRLFATMEEANQLELALGTHSRSGEQFDVWEAVFSPVGDDGYPKRLYDRVTGDIDREVAEQWKQHDLSHIVSRDWNKGLGEKLKGKINIFTGTMDSFYLDGAVRLFEDRVSKLQNPSWDGRVVYGYDKNGLGYEHCWGGGGEVSLDRLTGNQRHHREFVEQMLRMAPQGADVTSWRY